MSTERPAAAGDLTVVLAGGGTAGHVNPLLAVADALRTRHPFAQLSILGTVEGLETALVPARGYELSVVPRVPMPRRPNADLFRFPWRYRAAVAAAADVIDGADVVVGFGGYVSAPAYQAAHRLGVPIVVHEANARPGWANRLGARWASVVATTFPTTKLRRATCIGLPLRRELVDAAEVTPAQRAAARAEFGLDDRPTLLVTGGSLGAQRLNTVFASLAAQFADADVNVLHITGRGKDEAVRAYLGAGTHAGYVVRDYLADMAAAYAAADLVVCRAGAATVCELAVVGKPAVFVPLPFGNGEQALNAAPAVAAGAARQIPDKALSRERVCQDILPLLTNPCALVAMAAAARSLAKPRAADDFVDLIEGARR